MRRAPARRAPEAPPGRLLRIADGDRTQLFSQTLAEPPSLYGERVLHRGERVFRHFDPFRSKLAAALIRDPNLRGPGEGERWLYLGAAGGTTASHLADLLGPLGETFAVEKSPRPALRLLEFARRERGLYPILADARRPEEYSSLVPIVDGLYVDVAQPDQSAIVLENARTHLREGGRLFFCVKLSSLGRERSAEENLRAVEAELRPHFDISHRVQLAPFHRAHVLLAATFRSGSLPARRSAPRKPTRHIRPRPTLLVRHRKGR
jgi:fibrillarin-like pre-rRNA processing protein